KSVRCKKCDQTFTIRAARRRREESADLAERPIARQSSVPVVVVPADEDRYEARPIRRSRPKASRSFPWPLLIGGLVVAFIAFVGIAGAVVWLVLRGGGVPKNNPGPLSETVAPAKGLDELKAATVFVKVTAGPLKATGSGFVIRVDGETAYVVTND